MVCIFKNVVRGSWSVNRISCIVARALYIVMAIVGMHTFAQVENVPVGHPVYIFLQRCDAKNMLHEYDETVLPLSRKKIAFYLREIEQDSVPISNAEKQLLKKYLNEFEYEIARTSVHSFSLFNDVNSDDKNFASSEKHLYSYYDSNVAFIVDGILTLDYRTLTQKKWSARFAEFGGRVRGTISNAFGFYLQGTNAEFRGERNLLLLDKRLRTNYKIYDKQFHNFDFAEGYLRYEGDFLSAQIGRERIVWGRSFGEKFVLSETPPVFDFIRFDAHYKSFQYNFLHGWFNGKGTTITIPSSGDRVDSLGDKYVALHRIGVKLSPLFSFGIGEMVVYSNRSIDAAYLNPIIFFESVQRSRKDRDNTFLVFDATSNLSDRIQMRGSLLYDDINFKTFGTHSWDNRWGAQLGALFVDPFAVENFDLRFEYTRIEPYVFSHGRSYDNYYSVDSFQLGIPLQPNSELYLSTIQYFISPQWNFSV